MRTSPNAAFRAGNMSIKIYLLYVGAWWLAALSPGPAVMCSMAQSSRYGFRSSLAGISGIQLGSFIFFVCIALGLGTLLAAAKVAFTFLRVLGAIYLFYLGVRIIIASFRPAVRASQATVPAAAHRSLFSQGLLVQLTNPKVSLFVSALLPQFIDPHRSIPLQLVILLVTTIAIDMIVLSSYAYFAHKGIQSFRASRFSVWLERAFGAALIFFGFRLLASRK